MLRWEVHYHVDLSTDASGAHLKGSLLAVGRVHVGNDAAIMHAKSPLGSGGVDKTLKACAAISFSFISPRKSGAGSSVQLHRHRGLFCHPCRAIWQSRFEFFLSSGVDSGLFFVEVLTNKNRFEST